MWRRNLTQAACSQQPGGSYNLLVVGTDSNGTVQTSAIVPINVIQ